MNRLLWLGMRAPVGDYPGSSHPALPRSRAGVPIADASRRVRATANAPDKRQPAVYCVLLRSAQCVMFHVRRHASDPGGRTIMLLVRIAAIALLSLVAGSRFVAAQAPASGG